jgi:UDP-N-acetylmuramoylalanine--D-glutamate ligase
MAEAVHAARTVASPGDVVLLSPGCASFGLFRDEFDRGEQFRQAVRSLIPTEEARS